MKNQPGTLKNHKKNILEPYIASPEPWKTIKKTLLALWKTSLEPWKTNLEPRKTNLEPWKTIKTDLEKWKTNLNPWKPIKTDMEPWKTNLEPSKLTWSWTGWLWGVQVVTGDSQEEVIIFRYRHTNRHWIIIYLSHSLSSSSSSWSLLHFAVKDKVDIYCLCSPASANPFICLPTLGKYFRSHLTMYLSP